jgi:hypothetical protein
MKRIVALAAGTGGTAVIMDALERSGNRFGAGG